MPNENKEPVEIHGGNLKVVLGLEADEPFVGIYFANGEGFDQIAVYVDKDGKLLVEKKEAERVSFKTDDGYTLHRERKEDVFVWTDGDLLFYENENGHPIDILNEELFGVFI